MKKAKKQDKPVISVVSIDAGNGGTNAVLATEEGYKRVYFPSVRAVTTGDSLGLGAGFEMAYEWVEWGKGHKYLVGDDVFISRRAVERHTGANRYGNELQLFLIACALGKLIPEGGAVDLTLFAPPSMYVDAKETITERLADLKNTLAIRFKGDAKPRIYTIENLTVHPEGLGALLAFVLDDKGQLVQGDLLSGENVVLDGGMHTLDALQVSDGQFNPESLQSATWENAGIMAHILTPVLAVARKSGADFELIGLDDIDRVLRCGILTGDYSLVSGGSKIDLKPAIDKFSERYAQWISNQIIDGVFDGLRGIKSLIFVGGGAVLTAAYLQKWYAGKLLSMAQNPNTKNVSPVDANAVGGLRLALSRQKA
jgi:hypothetical protein